MTSHHPAHASAPSSSDWKPSLHTMAQVALAIQHTKSWQPAPANTARSAATALSASPPLTASAAAAGGSSAPFPRSNTSPDSSPAAAAAAAAAPPARRQSWKTEDLKHECHMSGVADIGECPGFTEHEHC
ncbi:hypothetical protein BROUX41_005895 [Berkeleyomyces rouxiae]|uniref:uncharacterized protein n=1 Tax=Berkeleyomyces rouxiae TaxID=2035830 RepID=UPI003B76D659